MPNFVQDPWAPLSYKTPIGDTEWGAAHIIAMGWAKGHGRRLNAYKILQSYLDNQSRHFSTASTEKELRDRREYGDAALIVEQVLSALLGDDQEIFVPDAANLGALKDQDSPTPEQVVELEFTQRAAAREEELREWAEDEKFRLKILETEGNAVGLGDGVYVLGLSRSKRRTQVRVYNPSFYFPVILDESAGDFPSRVHLAWEVVEDEGDWVQVDPDNPNPPDVATTNVRRLRRITYELRTLDTPRRYRWQEEDEEPSSVACFMTDAIWSLETGESIDSLASASAVYLRNEDGIEINNLDLQIDFIPVVHIPDTASFQHHFGRSVLSRTLQLLDDIQNADTDKQGASELVATPAIALSGLASDEETETYGPGTVFRVGDGSMNVLDTSGSLTAIASHLDQLLDRLSVNSRVSDAVLGRVKGQVPSGIALALSFGPLQSMIQHMRLVRNDKYPLLLKFVQKMMVAGGFLEDPHIYDARLSFGSFLPVDKALAVSNISALLTAKAISRHTAIELLIEAGFTIDDADEEVQRVQREDFAGANDLLAALGSEQAVFEYLDRDIPGEGFRRPVQPPEPSLESIPAPTPPGGSAPGGGDEAPPEEE